METFFKKRNIQAKMEYAVKHKFIVIIDVIASVNAFPTEIQPFVSFMVQIMVVTRALPANMNFHINRNNSKCYPLYTAPINAMNLRQSHLNVVEMTAMMQISQQYWLITIKKKDGKNP